MEDSFLTGVNYWPGRKAMYWWRDFEREEVARDFSRIAGHGLLVVRIFLTWEDFQPTPASIPFASLDHLRIVADLAAQNALLLMPTFFCGHMSGVNWLPPWMLEPGSASSRFPVFSGGAYRSGPIRNFYEEAALAEAQLLQIERVCGSLQGHPALHSYDLGNEASNLCLPASRTSARTWLEKMSGAIKKHSGGIPVTLGMHAEDLEEDRRLGPGDAALHCDYLSMHGYPFYLDWVEGHDVYLVPFLGIITSWLGRKPVLFQEFGAPSMSASALSPASITSDASTGILWSEDRVKAYYTRVLNLLREEHLLGAMAWCYSDYHPSLWSNPPLDVAPHERFFGIFRADGSPKPAAAIWSAISGVPADSNNDMNDLNVRYPWLNDFKQEFYYDDPLNTLQLMFRLYRSTR